MRIKDQLLQLHSKPTTDKVVAYIGNSQERFRELMDIFLGMDEELSRRSAWALSYSVLAHPELVRPYLRKIIKRLKNGPTHPAIGRNVFRFLMEIDIPESLHGEVYDLCFRIIPSEMYTLAERANAMTTAARIAKLYPELRNELRLVLEEMDRYPQPPAIKVRLKSNLRLLRS